MGLCCHDRYVEVVSVGCVDMTAVLKLCQWGCVVMTGTIQYNTIQYNFIHPFRAIIHGKLINNKHDYVIRK